MAIKSKKVIRGNTILSEEHNTLIDDLYSLNNYTLGYLNSDELISVDETGSARIDVESSKDTTTIFEFMAKKDDQNLNFTIKFYHNALKIFEISPETTYWKPYRIKIPSPYASMSKLICYGMGRLKDIKVINREPEYIDDNKRSIICLSHRGSYNFAPENTLEAFRYSNAQGIIGNEFDVDRTKDGVLVLSHDATIDRCSNGSGTIRDMTYKELLQYDFGYNRKSYGYKDVRIPTLEEALIMHRLSGQIPYIELKDGSINEDNVDYFVKLLHDTGVEEKCFIFSFDLDMLKIVSKKNNKLAMGWGCLPTQSYIDQVKNLGENAFISIFGFNKNDFSTYEPYADICLKNNIRFTGSSENLAVQKKIILKGAFLTALNDINIDGCYW